MPSPMTSMATSMERLQARLFKIEYCTIIRFNRYGESGIQCHSPDHPEYYNTVTIKVRNAKEGVDPLTLENQYEVVIQDFVGNCFGHPWTPRVGDLVLVLFLYNSAPIILGPVNTTYQEPPFRSPTCEDAMYDDMWKWCQWLKPSQDQNHDYYDHPKGRMPICKKLFHGPVTGKLGRGRDYQQVWDCHKGDCEPTCRYCEDIDFVTRYNEQWEKIYSSQTESSESPPSRWEHHAKCGSYIRLESETGCSKEYSEGCGHIRIGNAKCELNKKGHINFNPTGTIDIHSEHEETSIDKEVLGSRMMVTGSDMTLSDDHGVIAYEAKYLPLNAFIRIYRDGSIKLCSNNNTEYGSAEILLDVDGSCYLWDKIHNSYIEMQADGDIEISSSQANVKVISPIKVEIESPIVEMTCSDKVVFNTPKIYMGETLIHGSEE